MMETKLGRRDFLRQAGVASLAGAGLVLGLAACSGEEKPAAKATAAKTGTDPCNDLSALTAEEKATRTTFQYKEVTDDPKKPCDTCNFWLTPAAGQTCGGCTLVKGPVQPKGGCISWIEVQKT